MFCQVMGLKQPLDCRLWLSWLVSTTRGGGIGTFLGCGNVASPCNQSTAIVGTINKQLKQPLWQLLLFVQGHICLPMAHHVQTLGNLSEFCPLTACQFKP